MRRVLRARLRVGLSIEAAFATSRAPPAEISVCLGRALSDILSVEDACEFVHEVVD